MKEHRDLRLVLSAGLISLIGDWILRIGLIYYVYVLTSSTLASAFVMLSSFVPQVLLGSVAGIFVDRWDRKRTMVISNLLLAVGLLPLLLVHDVSRVWIAFVVLFWEGVIGQFFSPAEQAILPNLVADEQLVSANALNGQVRAASRLIGSAIGGVAAAAGGLGGVTFIDAASFVVSAALIGLMRTSGRALPSGDEESAIGHRLTTLRRDFLDGLGVVTRNRVLLLITGYLLVTCIGEGIMATLFAPFVRSVLHGSNEAYGIIVAVQAIGTIVGGLFAVSLGHRVSVARLLSGGSVVFGLIDLAIFLYPLGYVAVWPAIVGMVIVGLPGAVVSASVMTLLQRNTVDSHRGRVFGGIGAVEAIAILIGTLCAGWLGQAIGIVPVLAAQGAGYVLAGLALLALMRPEPAAEQAPPAQPASLIGPEAAISA